MSVCHVHWIVSAGWLVCAGFLLSLPPPPPPPSTFFPRHEGLLQHIVSVTLYCHFLVLNVQCFFFSRNRSCDLIVCKPTDKSNIYRQLLILTYTSLFTLVPVIFLDIFLDSSLLRGSLALSVAKRNIKNNIWDHATTTFRLILRSFRIFNQKWIR